jgi:hypothetical protein
MYMTCKCEEGWVEGLPRHLPYVPHYSQACPACPLSWMGQCPYPGRGRGR